MCDETRARAFRREWEMRQTINFGEFNRGVAMTKYKHRNYQSLINKVHCIVHKAFFLNYTLARMPYFFISVQKIPLSLVVYWDDDLFIYDHRHDLYLF